MGERAEAEAECEQCRQWTRASNVRRCRRCGMDLCSGCRGTRPCTAYGEEHEDGEQWGVDW
jgi:hypothetical protein